jgi:hypothetical protein
MQCRAGEKKRFELKATCYTESITFFNETLSTTEVREIVRKCDLATILLLIAAVIYLTVMEGEEAKELENKHPSINDYTIQVSNKMKSFADPVRGGLCGDLCRYVFSVV